MTDSGMCLCHEKRGPLRDEDHAQRETRLSRFSGAIYSHFLSIRSVTQTSVPLHVIANSEGVWQSVHCTVFFNTQQSKTII